MRYWLQCILDDWLGTPAIRARAMDASARAEANRECLLHERARRIELERQVAELRKRLDDNEQRLWAPRTEA